MNPLQKYMPPKFKSVARTVGYCLMLDDDVENWHALTVVMTARLSQRERGLMAWAALRSLDPETAAEVARAALPEGAGLPFDANNDPAGDASFWAAEATPDELNAYAVAIVSAMSERHKRAFLALARRAAA